MEIVQRPSELRDVLRARRTGVATIGFVPTMGFLHEGHLQLVDAVRAETDTVVMSIFVNPLQFAPSEDLTRYPRDTDGDQRKARERGVDLLFMPSADDMYPRELRVHVHPLAMADRWEGAVRPGHFAGVLTVVAKLFHLVQPDVAVFGQKDLQQVALIRAMVEDLDMPIRLIVAPIAREGDGLAMSSRNSFLAGAERERATALSRGLSAGQAAFAGGTTDSASLERAVLDVLAGSEVQPDYVAVADARTLEPIARARAGDALMLAARVGSTRLIDNVILQAA